MRCKDIKISEISRQDEKLLSQDLCSPELRQEFCRGFIEESKGGTFEISLLGLDRWWCHQGGMGWPAGACGVASLS